MDQVSKTELTVGFTSTFVVGVWLLWRRQARRSATLRLVDDTNKSMVITAEKEAYSGCMYDCVVCLCEVSPGDECRELPNCDHGVQFHAQCIGVWLKDHSTCPICRSHIPRPMSQCLHAYFTVHLVQFIVSYCNSVLENVASSIGDCRDF
ncbi:putative transcription factor C2H2 family [Helianthus annuus]|uniref:Putative zinc finger, RING/FYVE/PHD-type n=1 Tax=Helianthus annuus TaxID=4232 RepID=A0A251VAF4_HELAN|nr:putative transcription factor C2H2 family [Helianthus annuus]KAJ0592269.1 putative transcription factor C2H2 family [Helianthus annuus]KAJ0599772.1 putative transcription factor C2H2 family [Helianthus annuus]KAJ0607255.1 putative transcription factor C2H2 family [Helianthus annuus]KAJ0767315.1 putative transcription factor C2H2 family [Helianthus annuus]